MSDPNVIATLKKLSERGQLSGFAKSAHINRRTLQRIMGGGYTAHASTLRLVELELRKPRWESVR